MSDDKLSQEEMREDIKNIISWGHAHDYDDIIQEARADAWDEGYREGESDGLSLGHPLSTFSDSDRADNPYRKQEEV